MSRIINIISNNNLESKKTQYALSDSLKAYGFIPRVNYSEDAELNICIGGDGAFIRAVHKSNFTDIPFVGINTGTLGFFQEILPENIDNFLKNYLLENYYVEELSLLETKITTIKEELSMLAINEIAIKGLNSKVIHLKVFIDDNHLENFSGDGLIISTPVGSTGYNFSSGGSIVHPSLNTMQLTPLSPISSKAYRSLLNSCVVQGETVISVYPEKKYSSSVNIVLDGMENILNNIEKIESTISKKTIKKITFFKETYWRNLKDKFL